MNDETYDFPPFRPPSEADSLLLRVTRGCPWNQCAFCPMYKHLKFEKRDLASIKKDIDTAKSFTGGDVRTAFIADSDSLVIRTDDICEILEYLHAAFPSLTRVTSYARALTIKRKPLEHLQRIRAAGLTRLHFGLETGSAALLKRIRKGAGPATMIEGAVKAKEAGFEVSEYILLGIGGEAHWQEHARETARVLNEIDPHFIRLRTLVPVPGTPVFQWWKEGAFEMPSPETVFKEQRALIEGLTVNSAYLSDHVTNYAPINGKLPGDKEKMIEAIDRALEHLAQDEEMREELNNMRYMLRL